MDAVSGNILSIPVQNRPPIGAILKPTLAVEPTTAGAICEIKIIFTVTMNVTIGETITIKLTGFLGPVKTRLSVHLH